MYCQGTMTSSRKRVQWTKLLSGIRILHFKEIKRLNTENNPMIIKLIDEVIRFSKEKKTKNEVKIETSKRLKTIQWKRCFERVSLGIYSATNSLSSPSAQHPIKLTNLLNLSLPTPEASLCSKFTCNQINKHNKQKKLIRTNPKWKEDLPRACLRVTS